MKHLLFFDIDGTLISSGEKDFREDVKQALLKAKENDCGIFINSGRTYGIIESFIRDFPFDGFVLGCGSTILLNNQVLSFHGLNKTQRDLLINKIAELKLDAVFEGDEYVGFIHNGNDGNLNLENHYLKTGFQVYDANKERHIFNKCCVFPNQHNTIKEFYDYFCKEFEIIVRASFYDDPFFYEVVDKNHSKATGIREVAEYLHVPMEECYAFGDSTNDLSMLTAVKHSVAMGNAEEAVKTKVEYVTTDCKKDGIEQALKHYHFI